MFLMTNNTGSFGSNTIMSAKSLLWAHKIMPFKFNEEEHRLDSYLKVENMDNGVCISLIQNLSLQTKCLAYLIIGSIATKYAKAMRFAGVMIKVRTCEEAKEIVGSDTHQEKVMFQKRMNITQFSTDKEFIKIDIPYTQAARLMVAQEKSEPTVHPASFTLKIPPENIDALIFI